MSSVDSVVYRQLKLEPNLIFTRTGDPKNPSAARGICNEVIDRFESETAVFVEDLNNTDLEKEAQKMLEEPSTYSADILERIASRIQRLTDGNKALKECAETYVKELTTSMPRKSWPRNVDRSEATNWIWAVQRDSDGTTTDRCAILTECTDRLKELAVEEMTLVNDSA